VTLDNRRSGTTTNRPHASSDFHQHSLAVSAPCYLEQYTCFHPWFWHLGHFQNCSQNTSSTIPTRHATDRNLSVPPIHSFVSYGANHSQSIC